VPVLMHHSLMLYGRLPKCILNLGVRPFEGWACCSIIPREQAPCTHLIGGHVCPRPGLAVVGKRKIPAHARNWTDPQVSSLLSLTTMSYPRLCVFKQTYLYLFLQTVINLKLVVLLKTRIQHKAKEIINKWNKSKQNYSTSMNTIFSLGETDCWEVTSNAYVRLKIHYTCIYWKGIFIFQMYSLNIHENRSYCKEGL
jgi:hypothetical protein